jgi:hypothetical protein
MISAHILATSILWTVVASPLAYGADLSSYREFHFGMNLPAVVKLVSMNPSEVRVIHQRPKLIQDLDWQAGRYPGSSADAEPVKDILFSFCNGELFRMVVNYDRYKTEGLTAEDMIEGISAKYGTATRPTAEIIFPSIYNETVKVIARWEDVEYSLNLVRSSYQSAFGMVLYSKRLDMLARNAVIEALRLDEQEAPQREAELQRKQAEENRVKEEKARLVNKASFRP